MMFLSPRRLLRQLKPTFFTLICIGVLILLRNLTYDNSVYQSISLHQKMEYQIFSSFYQKEDSVRRVFQKKVAHLNELGLSNLNYNEPVPDDIVCRHPKLDLSNDANKAAFFDVGSIQCFGRELFRFENGVLMFNRTSLRGDVIRKCSYQAVERIDDNYATYTTPLTRNSSPFDMVLQHDFIRVQCYFEIGEPTDYQRSLLSMNSRYGKRLLSIREKQAGKVSLQNPVQPEKSKNRILRPAQESGTSKTRKKMAQDLKRPLLIMPLSSNKSLQKSRLKRTVYQKMVKNGTVLLSPKIKDEKSPNRIKNINQSTSADQNSLNILSNQLQESEAKEKIPQPNSSNHSKKIAKQSENFIIDIPNPLSIQNHKKFDQKLANQDVTKRTSDSNPNHRIINKSQAIPQPPLLVLPRPSLNKDQKDSVNNIFKSEDTSSKYIPKVKMAVKNQAHLSAISHSNIRHQLNNKSLNTSHIRQQQNITHINQHTNNTDIGHWQNGSYISQKTKNKHIPQWSNSSHINLKIKNKSAVQRSNSTHISQKTKTKHIGQWPDSLHVNKQIQRTRIGQQPNSLRKSLQPKDTHFQKMAKSQQAKKISKNKKLIQLSPKLSKQKNKSFRQRNDLKLSHIKPLKNTKLKETFKLSGKGYNHLNKAIPALKNVGLKKTNSQKNQKKQIYYRKVNYPELNIKQGNYLIKKKEKHLSKNRNFDSNLLKLKSLEINRKKNASHWQKGVRPFAKSLRRYFKKLPTLLAQLPKPKEHKNVLFVNKSMKANSNITSIKPNSNITSIKQFPTKNSVIPKLILEQEVLPSMNQPTSDATGHDKINSDHGIKNSISKSETKMNRPTAMSESQENQVPPIPRMTQANQTFNVFALKPKSSEVKKNMAANDSASYDNPREMYVNLPPEDYGINEELPDIEQFFVQIYPKPEVFQRISEVPPFLQINVIPLNILIYGLDSLSHLSFQRKLPLTYNYLKDSLDAVIMNGYNIVGDATTAAIIPLLTGKTETELPEVRKNQLASGFVDDYPLIWNKYRSKGYATLFAEDSPSLAVFNLRFNGFYTAPTDHYMRPFWQAVSESVLHERSLNFCLGSKPKHQFTLDYVKEFFEKYNNVSKFAFAFHGELSHNDNNPVQYLDKDLHRFLRQMKQQNFLNNTLLIIMSDHGARYSNVRNTVQGKLEERLPFMSFVFPPWFQKKYPYFANNLKGNREKLVTPFDVHETLLDLLDTSRMYEPVDTSTRGISLLQSVPLNRTCRSAGIAMHWCSCLTRFDVNPSTPLVQMSLHKILSYIRTLLLPVKHLCAGLSLKKIIYAYLVTPNEKVLKFTNSKDADNRVANFSQQMLLDTVHYQLTFETYPNGGLYEASVQVDIRKETFKVFPEISRLNKYGEQPSCIKEGYPDLRKYCYCKIK